ncbi:MAG TPA: plastocyanin/azurin family copper-binding protein [Albidovulum sp.]|uniref:cupredoxin domain-containing protein n=1 Tax=Albidovulum sp. TaxID=1872424 RepID=UPI002D178735|nr:plastocyanin/azurin family copper-binding protein [Albidovulum sp.]
MSFSRRLVLALGGGALATLVSPGRPWAGTVETVEMRGTARGERIWFEPRGLAVSSGTTIRFLNHDPGNSHTATAYHPSVLDRLRRIPKAAAPWDSDFLLPGQSFEVTLTAPGVYDFYCQPHEPMGMVGRIVVGTPETPGWEGPSADTTDIAADSLAVFPAVADILAKGRIGGA